MAVVVITVINTTTLKMEPLGKPPSATLQHDRYDVCHCREGCKPRNNFCLDVSMIFFEVEISIQPVLDSLPMILSPFSG